MNAELISLLYELFSKGKAEKIHGVCGDIIGAYVYDANDDKYIYVTLFKGIPGQTLSAIITYQKGADYEVTCDEAIERVRDFVA